jgi:hypothetical protein
MMMERKTEIFECKDWPGLLVRLGDWFKIWEYIQYRNAINTWEENHASN